MHLRPTNRHRLLACYFAATLAAALVAGLFVSRQPAVGRGGEADLAAIGSLVPDDSLDPRLIDLRLEGRRWSVAVDELDAALFARSDTQRRLDGSLLHLADSEEQYGATQGELDAASSTVATIGTEIDELELVLRERAIALFVSHGDEDIAALASAENAASEARIEQLSEEVDEAQFATRAELLSRRDDVENDLAGLGARAIELETTIASLEASIEVDKAHLAVQADLVDAARAEVSAARITSRVGGSDLSVVALDAYLKAEVLLSESSPECELEWWMIAGIGRVESRHGTIGGRSLLADGRVDRAIVGIALDGGDGVRAVVDTDNGSLDGDVEWDRAVGPMQFIPETWRIRSRDATGDGVADPQNIYDAAYTTGRYLCRLGGHLDASASLGRAYYGYNTSLRYVEDVERFAARYKALDLPRSP